MMLILPPMEHGTAGPSYLPHHLPHQQSCEYTHLHGRHPSTQNSAAYHFSDPSPSSVEMDLRIRIATLEKDLDRCKAEKAEAEIAVQYLAQLNADSAAKAKNEEKPEVRIALVEAKLHQEILDKIKIQAQLTQAVSIILSFAPSRATTIPSTSDRQTKEAPNNLIDLLDAGQESSTLINEPQNVHSEGIGTDRNEDHCFETPESSTEHESFGSEAPESDYIVRFVKEKKKIVSPPPQSCDTNAPKVIRLPDPQSSDNPGEPNFPNLAEPTTYSTVSGASASFFSDSSNDDVLFPSGPISTSTSFGSDIPESIVVKQNQGRDHSKPFALMTAVSTNTGDPEPRIGSSHSVQPLSDCVRRSVPSEEKAGDELRWNKTEIFTEAELQRGQQINHREAGVKDLRCPDVFRYGLVFDPRRIERNAYRAVVISNLPSDITMKMLLDQVRGGMVSHAQILDTVAITGAKSAMVTFLFEHVAIAYETYAQQHVVAFSSGRRAHVARLHTPTWPLPVTLSRMIQDRNLTRCLEVSGIPGSVGGEELEAAMGLSPFMKSTAIESMRRSGDGTLGIRFCSVKLAAKAAGALENHPRCRGCKINWLPDPCAQSLQSLVQKNQPPEGETVSSKTIMYAEPTTGKHIAWSTSAVNPCNMPLRTEEPPPVEDEGQARNARINKLKAFNEACSDTPFKRMGALLECSRSHLLRPLV